MTIHDRRAAFSSVAAVRDKDFLLRSDSALGCYESSPGKNRYFCPNCARHIYAKKEDAKHIVLRLGSLDDDPKTKEISHVLVSQKATWYSLNSQLPEYLEFE
ncbi:GFA family protein [Moritella sp. 24]|uniref:GFA family protein n=1 Tax=Moritella sp. 24 TaxID=2746230 RepID=UPI001BA58377|nr:GFA family protein [Moritella sp. 24]